MQIFKLMSNRSFAATLAAWSGDKGRNLRDMFWQLVANGIVRTYDSNDVSHVNKLVAMAVNTGQLRRFGARTELYGSRLHGPTGSVF